MMRESRESTWARRVGRGLRAKVNLLIFKDEDQRYSDLPFMVVGWSCFQPLGLGWPTLVAIPLLVMTGVSWRPCQEFRQVATLTDVLQMLDEHYSIVMMFNTLSKELYSHKQDSGENVAEFRVCLSQQVQILQSEYPGRIQQEHVEEMKKDHFYKGLNPKYQHIFAHKVNGKHLASYSNLLLAAWKLERWAEARDPLLLKTTMTGGSNVTQPHRHWGIFSL